MMLIFPLKKKWYEKIKSGEKTVEYREVKPYWNRRFFYRWSAALDEYYVKLLQNKGASGENCNIPCLLRLGYTKQYMSATIVNIAIADGKDTDLHIDKPVYAIHLADVKEAKKT